MVVMVDVHGGSMVDMVDGLTELASASGIYMRVCAVYASLGGT